MSPLSAGEVSWVNDNHGIDPDKDAAGIMLANGNLLKVFDYKDGWKPKGDQ